jgi:hypothetical protein
MECVKLESSSERTQLDRIEKEVKRISLVGWFFGGFALFVAAMVFIKDYTVFSFMWWCSLAMAIFGVIIIICVFFGYLLTLRR